MLEDVESGGRNRDAWNVAARKYVEETAALAAEAQANSSLLPIERELLSGVMKSLPRVLHLQSGQGLDSIDLSRSGASQVVAVDFSEVTTGAAARRSRALGASVGFVVGDALAVPLRSEVADLVYTGKGALMWLADLSVWAVEVARLLVRGGHLFVFEEHPAASLWTGDDQTPGLRVDRTYFGGTRVNDTFPASAIRRFSDDPGLVAVEWQWTMADLVNAVVGAGMSIMRLDEYPEPFWRPADGTNAAAWNGTLPNSMSLLARRT